MREDADKTALRWCAAMALAVILIPVALYARPPVVDFANHAARIWLMNGGLANPALARAYAADWSDIYSNIGADLVAGVLSPLTGGFGAARIALALALLTPAFGLMALNVRLAGRLTWWTVALPFFAWTSTFLFGFLNFQIGVGLALAAAAGDAAMARGGFWKATLARAACGFATLLFHPFAALFYAALVAALAIGAEWKAFRDARAYLNAAAASAAALAPFVLWLVLAPRLPLANFPTADLGSTFSFDIRDMILRVASPFLAYHTLDNLIDALFAVLALAPFALVLLGRARLHAGLAALALALALATIFVPRFLVGTDLSVRTAFMAVLAAAAAFSPADAKSNWARAAMIAALALVCARTAWIGAHWQGAQNDVAAVERALSDVPAGAAVLVLAREPTQEAIDAAPVGRYLKRHSAAYWHYGAYAVIDRGAFVPTLFAAKSQQPLRVRPPYDEISSPLGCYMVPAQALYDDALATHGAGACAPYAALWRERFDYVLVLNADETRDANGAFTPPAGLVLSRDAGFARVYRVER